MLRIYGYNFEIRCLKALKQRLYKEEKLKPVFL